MSAANPLCRFCERRRPLRRSHILPRFVYAHQKQHFGVLRFVGQHGDQLTGFAQDGHRRLLLCGECEQVFGRFERLFAQDFFRPFVAVGTPISYGTWLAKFCAVTSWRVLTNARESGGPRAFPPAVLGDAEVALKAWKNVIAGIEQSASPFDFHMVPLDQGPTRDDWMHAWAVGRDTFYSHRSGSAYVVSKLGPLAVFGTVKEPEPSAWGGTRVGVTGVFGGGGDVFRLPGVLHDCIDGWRKRTSALSNLSTEEVKRRGRPKREPPQDGPDYRVMVYGLGKTDNPTKLAIEMRPLDELWERFYVAYPSEERAFVNAAVRIGPAGDPWPLPNVAAAESHADGLTFLSTAETVKPGSAGYLVGDRLPSSVAFGSAAGPPKRLVFVADSGGLR